MSYLYRTGNGRNNIAFTNTANSSTKYLRRTSSGRNNITWTTIPSGSTYNILQRNGTGRTNILWANLNIPAPGLPQTSSDIPVAINLITAAGNKRIQIGNGSTYWNTRYTVGSNSGTTVDIRNQLGQINAPYATSVNDLSFQLFNISQSTNGINLLKQYFTKVTVISTSNSNKYITVHVDKSSCSTSGAIFFDIIEFKYGSGAYSFTGNEEVRVVLSQTW